jgi:hypothetical protein
MRKFLATFFLMSSLLVSSVGAQTVVLDGVPVGTTNPSTGKFTNLEATTQFTLGAQTATSFDGIDGKTVKSSATDSTAGFLTDELQAGTNVTISEIDVGGNKKLSVAVADKLTTKGDVLTHDGINEVSLPVGASGQFLTSDTGGNLLWTNPAEGDQLFNSNVLLNSYRTAENLNLSVLKMIDGTVDAFTNESGVDTTASTNESFDSNNDLYSPTDDGSGLTVPFVTFDGTNDSLNVDDATLGHSDGKQFLISFWMRTSQPLGTPSFLFVTAAPAVTIGMSLTFDNDKLRFRLSDSTGAKLAEVTSTTEVTSNLGLVHVLVAVDLNVPTVQMAINGVLETLTISVAPTNGTGNFKNTTFFLGISQVGNALFEGEMGQFYIAQEYLDISVQANIDKFYDNGNPVDLGTDGSTPTGTAPIIFLNNPLATWKNNLGSGGNLTEVGPLTAGTDITTPGIPDNLTLISNSQTAKTEANGANILLLAEDVAADIVLNTDLKASVSRDGGTTYSQVTLSDAGEFEKGNLLTGTVDLSSQPTGTDMEWKVETLNNKALNLHGVGLEWR